MSKLALLPTGEAIRPQDVRRVRIQPQPVLLEQEALRYAVVLELVDEAPWTLKEGLALEEAISFSRRCSQAINEGLVGE